LLCCTIAVALLLFGEASAAGGVMLGFLMFAGNGFLLVEISRALLLGESAGRLAGALSAVGRILLLGVLLSGVFLLLGRSIGLGACGGLLASQVHLHLPIRRTGVAT